jgi:pimeloyl-ACP methyl ester carboxylesterase
MSSPTSAELDAKRFRVRASTAPGFRYATVDEGSGPALLLVHGWPETKRIWWRNVEPLARAGFRVIAPDLRGFGESDVAPDGLADVASHSRDLAALLDDLGVERCVLVGGDLGGAVIQDFARRFPARSLRMVIFNSPLPYLKDKMAALRNTRPPAEAADYFLRQGTDADALARELDTPEKRRRYIATFYGSRFWAHPGTFARDAVDFMTEPFADGAKLRASFGNYESSFDPKKRREPSLVAENPSIHTLILYGPSDHVIYPEFDRMAAFVFPDHVGPFLVRDAGHFLQWEAAGVLNSAVISFCRDLLPR